MILNVKFSNFTNHLIILFFHNTYVLRSIIVDKCKERALYKQTRFNSDKQKYNKLTNYLEKSLKKT